MPRPTPLRCTLPLLVAWSCLATYLVAARVVGNWFPLSTFDMYQGHAPQVVARVVVLDAAGRARELQRFEAYACEPEAKELAATVAARCSVEHRPLPYVVRDQQRWLDAHLGTTAERATADVSIVSRAYLLADRPGTPAFNDCVLARCTATRRGGLP